MDNKWYPIHELCSKGPLHDVLQDQKYRISEPLKFSLAIDLAKGMAFLHNKSIIHGALRSSCCIIDAKWTAKVADWEYNSFYNHYLRLLSKNTKSSQTFPLNNYVLARKEQLYNGDYAKVLFDFGTAPEILKTPTLKPDWKCDVYSYSMIIQEIWTREDPFSEILATTDVQDILLGIKKNFLRPRFNEDTAPDVISKTTS